MAVRLEDDSFFKSLQRMTQERGITGKDLVTGMVVPWRSDWARTALQATVTAGSELGITGKDLVTFKSESVARRMDDDSFCTVIERLEQESGITGQTGHVPE